MGIGMLNNYYSPFYFYFLFICPFFLIKVFPLNWFGGEIQPMHGDWNEYLYIIFNYIK